jgi:hypothetical protein
MTVAVKRKLACSKTHDTKDFQHALLPVTSPLDFLQGL